jgi:hypothetical protein
MGRILSKSREQGGKNGKGHSEETTTEMVTPWQHTATMSLANPISLFINHTNLMSKQHYLLKHEFGLPPPDPRQWQVVDLKGSISNTHDPIFAIISGDQARSQLCACRGIRESRRIRTSARKAEGK